MELKFEIKHNTTFDEFYKKRERKLMPKFIVRIQFNKILQNCPNNEWIVYYRFYDTHIEVITNGVTQKFEYSQFNGILDFRDNFHIHRYGKNLLTINKDDFIQGDVNEFPYFISDNVSQDAPSQLIMRNNK